MDHARRLLALAEAHGLPVFHVQHSAAAGGALFAEGGAMADFHAALQPAPHHQVLRKSRTSSFAGTDLHAQLQAQGAQSCQLVQCSRALRKNTRLRAGSP